MLRILPLAVALLCAGCATEPVQDPSASALLSRFPGLPADAGQVAERLAACNHFASETGDNSPEPERELARASRELRCDRIERDVAAIRTKYSGNRQVELALAAADEL